MSLYAIVKMANNINIRIIPTDENTLKEISDVFIHGFNKYLNEDILSNDKIELKEAVSFEEDWINDIDTISVINDYVNDNDWLISDDSELEEIDSDEYQGVSALFIKYQNFLLIQNVDSRNVITPKNKFLLYRLFGSESTIHEFNKKFYGFILSDNVHAVVDNNNLYFQSFTLADRALDLTDYTLEAGTKTMESFYLNEIIACEDKKEDFLNITNKIVIKDVARIISSGVLEDHTAKYFLDAYEKCKDYVKFKLEITNDKKIVIPKTAKQRNAVLKFLRNTVVQSVLDGEFYSTNSKRRLIK